MAPVSKPNHIKYRREPEGGLVYDHENYGYDDASMYEVSDTVIDVLEFVGEECPRDEVDQEFSPATVETLLNRGVLVNVE